MLIVEDLLLLLTNPETGQRRMIGHEMALALAGGLLADLVAAGYVRVTEDGESVRKDRVVVEAPPVVADPLLRHGLSKLAGKVRNPRRSVEVLARGGLVGLVTEHLVEREVLSRQTRPLLGFIPHEVFLPVSRPYHDELLSSLDAVLLRGEQPTEHSASLIALLSAVNKLAPVLAREGQTFDKRAVKARAKELRAQYWAAVAAGKALEQARAAAAAAGSGG